MRNSRHLVSLRTFGLAFAVVLSPALMQTSELSCGTGDTTLSVLEFEVNGKDMIKNFDPEHRVYEVTLPDEVDVATIRALSTDQAAQVMCNLSNECPPPVDHGNFQNGGGEMTLDELPLGHSVLKVYVHAPEGAGDFYSIHVMRSIMCP